MASPNKGGDDNGNRSKDEGNKKKQDAEYMKLWGVFVFGVIGATATTFAVSQLRRTVAYFYTQLARSQSRGPGSTFRGFQEEARRRYNQRLREEYEEEMERVERIRRMQSVFNRERNKYKSSYESWREHGPGAYNQHFQRDDWNWKGDTSFRDQRTNYRERSTRESAKYHPLSQHYSILGLDRTRAKPYTEAEIKTAFRTKAKEFHPDQNPNNKEAAEEKFKQVLTSYEAIKQERKDVK